MFSLLVLKLLTLGFFQIATSTTSYRFCCDGAFLSLSAVVLSKCIDCILEKAMAPHSRTLAWKIPWWAAVHGVAKSQTRLSDFTFTFQFHALEKEMATHSSVLAWRIPGTGKPGGLPSMGSHRVGHD